MKKRVPAANPDAYVAELTGWQRGCVEALRAAVRGAATLHEVVQRGHLVYLLAIRPATLGAADRAPGVYRQADRCSWRPSGCWAAR